MKIKSKPPCLCLRLLRLQVLISPKGNGTAEEQEGVEANAEAGGICRGRRGRGGRGELRCRVAGLSRKSLMSASRSDEDGETRNTGDTNLSLQETDFQGHQLLARLVAVSDVLERLGGVLAADV